MLQGQLKGLTQVYAGCQLVPTAIGHTRVYIGSGNSPRQAPTAAAAAAHADSRHVAEHAAHQQHILQVQHEQQQQQQQRHKSTVIAAPPVQKTSAAAPSLQHVNGTCYSGTISNSSSSSIAAHVNVDTIHESTTKDIVASNVTNGNGRQPHMGSTAASLCANKQAVQPAAASVVAAAEAKRHLQPEQQQQQHHQAGLGPPQDPIQWQDNYPQQQQQYGDKQQEQGQQLPSQQLQQQLQQQQQQWQLTAQQSQHQGQQQQQQQGDCQPQQQRRQRQQQQLTVQQLRQRWQQRQQKKQVKQHQQQLTRQRLQQLQRCTDWRQLLLLAGDAAALQGDAEWLCAVITRAAQLCQPAAAAAAAADHNQLLDASTAAGVVDLQGGVFAAASGAVDQARHVQLQQQRFMNNLLILLGRSLQAAAAAAGGKRHTAAAAAAPTAGQLCQVLTQLANYRVVLPFPVQQQLKAYIGSSSSNDGRSAAWQAAESSAVVVALAQLKPTAFTGQNCPTLLQQQLLEQALNSVLAVDCDGSQVQTPASAKQAAALLWAAARLRWRPSQHWVLAAAAAVVQQVNACSAGELAAALWGLAHLRCDMLLRRQTLQQQQGSDPSSSSSSNNIIQQQWGTHRQHQGLLPRPTSLAPDRLLQAVLDRLTGFNAQDLVKVLFATAQIPLLPQRQLVQELLQLCQQQSILATYTDVDLECILWSLARMQQHQDLEGQQQQQQQSGSSRLHLYRQRQRRRQQQRQFINIKMQPPHSETLIKLESIQPLLNAVLLQLPASDINNVSSVLYSVVLLDLKPPGPWLARVLNHVAVHMSSLSPSGLAFVIFAVAEFRFLPSPAWLARFYAASLPLLHSSSSTVAAAGGAAVAAAHSSSSSGRVVSTAAGDLDHISSSTNSGSSSSCCGSGSVCFDPSQLAMVAAAVYKISKFRNTHFQGQKPPAAWLDALAAASLVTISSCNSHSKQYNSQFKNSGGNRRDSSICAIVTPGALSLWGSVMKRFSSLAGEPWPGPGTSWYDCYITTSERSMLAASPWDLCNILQAVVSMQKRLRVPSESWVKAAISASRAVLAAAAAAATQQQQRPSSTQVITAVAADVVLIGKSFAQMHVLPDQHWRQLWVAAVEIRGTQMTSSLQATFAWTKRTFASLEQQQRQQGEELTATPCTAASSSTMGTLISSMDSLTEGHEDEYEPPNSKCAECELQSGDLDHPVDPAAEAANSSSIVSGNHLAQPLHHQWEQQQDAVGQMLGVQQLDTDSDMVHWGPEAKHQQLHEV